MRPGSLAAGPSLRSLQSDVFLQQLVSIAGQQHTLYDTCVLRSPRLEVSRPLRASGSPSHPGIAAAATAWKPP